MTMKITVNGTPYGSVDDMPPNVRAVYEQTLAKLPELADQDGEGVPGGIQHESLSVRHGMVVRKKIVVNGTTYDGESQLPPDVRQIYEQAMGKAKGDPTVTKNEIKISFQMSGPVFKFRKSTGSAATNEPPAANPTPSPIEVTSGSNLRFTLLIGACAVAAALFWLLTRAHQG